jgi:dTDP-4-dehydrorhamnose 3,5-epimerase
MPFTKTQIEDVVIFEPRIFKDKRGYFFESYSEKIFADFGIKIKFIQDNQSMSSYGTIRGLHFQKGDDCQAKLVRVLKGKVLDVVVDIRKDSPTFGKHVSIELSEDNFKQLYVPHGFAHGFSVLSETAIFAYKCDNLYAPESEGAIKFDDAELGIDWKVPLSSAIISDKDMQNQPFSQYKKNPCF